MNICDIGGSEQYIYNKYHFLKKLGYDVYVIHGLPRPIMIEDLKQFAITLIPVTMYSPFLFANQEICATIDKLANLVNKHERDWCCIESHGVDTAMWGELLAAELKCKHLVFNMQEVHNYSPQEIDYLRFKLNHKELAGITSKSVAMMLDEPDLRFEPWMQISAYCNNVVDDVKDYFSQFLWNDAAVTFGSIGRLEKEFVTPMLKQLAEYIARHPNIKYNVLMIGGTRVNGVEKTIRNIFNGLSNANLVITGYVYPISRTLLQKTDVFISTAGAASVSYLEGKPTIRVHPVSGKITGVLGSTEYKVETMYDVLDDADLGDIIDKILDRKIKIEYQEHPYEKYNYDMKNEFNRQLAMAEPLAGEYYDTRNIKGIINLKYIFYYVIGHLFGGDAMQNILEKLRRKFK